MIVEIIIFFITAIIANFIYIQKKNERFFKDHDVKFVPGWPMFGNTVGSTFAKKHFIEDIDSIYRAFPNERYVGFVEANMRILLIRDPELIKLITVKDFDHFVNHREVFSDPLLSQSLLMMKGDRWREMRATMSPAFTGSKMRNMVPFITEIGQNFIDYMKESEGEKINLADLMRKYTNDVIASTAFGLKVNSLKDPENNFYKYGQNMMTFTAWQRIKIMFMLMVPFLKNYNISIFQKETTDFFRDIVKKTMSDRQKNNIERPDMIQLLMEAYKGTLKANVQEKEDKIGFATTEEANTNTKGNVRSWSLDELVAQAFIFFFAAFESTATVLILALHELALNEEVQKKLYEEVKEHHAQYGKLVYEGVPELKYLDCVLNETFRKWSPAFLMDRVCQKSYTLPPPREDAAPYTIKAGDIVYNLVTSLHMDEKYYPEPEKFDPERFSDENKHNIKPFTFMPFGSGPRNCIGSRFALLELKILLYLVIVNFEVLRCEKTTDPVKLSKDDFNIRAEGGSWVKFKARI